MVSDFQKKKLIDGSKARRINAIKFPFKKATAVLSL